MRRVRGWFVVVALLLATGLVSVVAQSGKGGPKTAKPYTTWTAYGGGPHSSQFTRLTVLEA